jgi:hypothetical protein
MRSTSSSVRPYDGFTSLEAPQRPVVAHHLALALQDVDVDGRLVVDERGEHLAAARRNGRVAQDDLRHHAAHGLDAEREGRDVEQQHLPPAAHEDVGLDRGTEGDDLVGIEVGVWLAAEQALDLASHHRDPGGSPDHHDFVHLVGAQARVLECLPARSQRALDDGRD